MLASALRLQALTCTATLCERGACYCRAQRLKAASIHVRSISPLRMAQIIRDESSTTVCGKLPAELPKRVNKPWDCAGAYSACTGACNARSTTSGAASVSDGRCNATVNTCMDLPRATSANNGISRTQGAQSLRQKLINVGCGGRCESRTKPEAPASSKSRGPLPAPAAMGSARDQANNLALTRTFITTALRPRRRSGRGLDPKYG